MTLCALKIRTDVLRKLSSLLLMKFKLYFAGVLALLFIGITANAFAQEVAPESTKTGYVGKTQIYKCPYLHDTNRQTISALTQGRDGWFFRKGDINEYFALLPHAKNYLTRLNEAFKSQGATLILLQVPPRPFTALQYFDRTQPGQQAFNLTDAMHYYKLYLEQLRSTGATVVEVTDKMNRIDPKTGLHFFYKRDAHWSPLGSNLSAEKIGEIIKKTDIYKTITPATYQTEVTGELQMKSTIAMEIDSLCDDIIPAEPYPSYQTNVQLEKGENALFGDVSSSPPLILLGSSFSAIPWFNFDGFLSEHTGLEVANFAISAGKLFNSLVSYTSLPKDKRLNPNFIVWENLAHYDFNLGDSMFRQAIPAVYGECSEQEAVKSTKITVKSGSETASVFELPADLKVNGSDYYLYISSDNPGLSNFTLEMDYDDGDGEWFIIDRRENFTNSGRFFAELSDEIDSSLISLNLIGLPDIDATLDVRLCRIKK